MILDASALVLLSLRRLPDDHAARLRRILGQAHEDEGVDAPHLLHYEMGNVIHGRLRHASAHRFQGRRDQLAHALALVGLTHTKALESELAGALSEEHGLTFYDGAYAAHARLRGRPLVTADRTLHRAAATAGVEAYLLPDQLDLLEARYFPSAST